jgi:hypothetical protein
MRTVRTVEGLARGTAIAFLSVAFFLAGCGSKQDLELAGAAPDPKSQVAPNERVRVEGMMEYAQPTAYVDGVGLRGVAQGSTVAISLHNRREEAFLVEPSDFGVIVDGSLRRVDEPGAADLSLFPNRIELEPGASAMGVIRFPGIEDLAGQRLVFNNPRIGVRFFVRIEGTE